MSQYTTVIVDQSVIYHQIHDIYVSLELEKDKEHWLGVLKAQLVWLQSGQWLGNLIVDSANTQIVSVCDVKPYWRLDYLLQEEVYSRIPIYKRGKASGAYRNEPVHYKAGRAFPAYNFTKIKEKGRAIFEEQGWRSLALSGYEADDMAAAIVMTNRMLPKEKQHRIILATVDADWMGLIDENTTWFCSYGWLPRVRYTMEQINLWASRRLKATITEPRQIWDVKQLQGDKSDNLPAGTPLEVIDLTQPPEEHKVWLKPGMKSIISNILENPKTIPQLKTEAAQDYLRRLGIPRCVRPYEGFDVNPWQTAA